MNLSPFKIQGMHVALEDLRKFYERETFGSIKNDPRKLQELCWGPNENIILATTFYGDEPEMNNYVAKLLLPEEAFEFLQEDQAITTLVDRDLAILGRQLGRHLTYRQRPVDEFGPTEGDISNFSCVLLDRIANLERARAAFTSTQPTQVERDFRVSYRALVNALDVLFIRRSLAAQIQRLLGEDWPRLAQLVMFLRQELLKAIEESLLIDSPSLRSQLQLTVAAENRDESVANVLLVSKQVLQLNQIQSAPSGCERARRIHDLFAAATMLPELTMELQRLLDVNSVKVSQPPSLPIASVKPDLTSLPNKPDSEVPVGPSQPSIEQTSVQVGNLKPGEGDLGHSNKPKLGVEAQQLLNAMLSFKSKIVSFQDLLSSHPKAFRKGDQTQLDSIATRLKKLRKKLPRDVYNYAVHEHDYTFEWHNRPIRNEASPGTEIP